MCAKKAKPPRSSGPTRTRQHLEQLRSTEPSTAAGNAGDYALSIADATAYREHLGVVVVPPLSDGGRGAAVAKLEADAFFLLGASRPSGFGSEQLLVFLSVGSWEARKI